MRRLLLVGVLFLLSVPLASARTWLIGSEPVVTVPTDITIEADTSAGTAVTFTATADDVEDGPLGVTCSPPSGTTFDITTTSVTCTSDPDTDGNVGTGSFTVTVQDTTAPNIASHAPVNDSTADADKIVNFTEPTANDFNDVSSVTVACTPASGTTFALGTTNVTCTATDGAGNSASTSFDVILADVGNPQFSSVPGPITTEATGPLGAPVAYSLTATDNSGVSPTITCGGHESGSTFPIAVTTVTCTATDGTGNHADSDPFTVTVQDTHAPVLGLPADISAEADSTSGKVVSYSATASDTVAGTVAPTCSPASGSTFPVGTTTVNCSATDGHNPPATGSFTVTVSDSSGPVLSGYANKTAEANGPTGSFVNYPVVSATDSVDGPIAIVTCVPASGTRFSIGTTVVNCSATDSHGNTGQASFNVNVVDTTPPAIYLPTGASIVATSATGIASSDPGAQTYFQAVRAVDIIDPHPIVNYEAPALLSVGPNPITFHARDAAGNESVKTVTLTVLPLGSSAPPTPTAPTPPADVKNVKVTPLDGAVRIQWDAGGRQVVVTRSSSSTRPLASLNDERVVYSGTGSSYTDRGLTNGVEYRYVVMAVDAAGNHSAGVAAVIVPRRSLLKSPKDGARLKKAPKLLWALDAEAQYYNAQLLLNGKKILSAWPLRPAYVLKKSWKFEGRKYTLKPGVYTWFVWPGYGARSAVDYGELMGTRTFRIIR